MYGLRLRSLSFKNKRTGLPGWHNHRKKEEARDENRLIPKWHSYSNIYKAWQQNDKKSKTIAARLQRWKQSTSVIEQKDKEDIEIHQNKWAWSRTQSCHIRKLKVGSYGRVIQKQVRKKLEAVNIKLGSADCNWEIVRE